MYLESKMTFDMILLVQHCDISSCSGDLECGAWVYQ